MNNYCLLAVSGDCSAGAMSAEASFLPISPEHWEGVKTFLRAQLEWEMVVAEGGDRAEKKESLKPLMVAYQALLEAGLFVHKYHFRTTWALWEMEDGVPVNVGTPVRLEKAA